MSLSLTNRWIAAAAIVLAAGTVVAQSGILVSPVSSQEVTTTTLRPAPVETKAPVVSDYKSLEDFIKTRPSISELGAYDVLKKVALSDAQKHTLLVTAVSYSLEHDELNPFLGALLHQGADPNGPSKPLLTAIGKGSLSDVLRLSSGLMRTKKVDLNGNGEALALAAYRVANTGYTLDEQRSAATILRYLLDEGADPARALTSIAKRPDRIHYTGAFRLLQEKQDALKAMDRILVAKAPAVSPPS